MPNHIRKALLRGQAYRSPHDLRRVMIKLDGIAREMDKGIEAMSASVDRFLQIRPAPAPAPGFAFVPLDVQDATITIGNGPREAFNGTIEVRIPAGAAAIVGVQSGQTQAASIWKHPPTPTSLLELLEKEPHSWGGDPE